MPTRVGSTKAGATHRKKTARIGTGAECTKTRRPKRAADSEARVFCEPTRNDVMACVTSDELSEEIESAFAALNAPGAGRGDGERQTPRIQIKNTKPLLVVSYTYEHEEQHLGVRADLVDISADGLGIILAKPIPVGATVRFALADENGEPVFGYASVARTARRNRKYWLGVTFMDSADSLDIEESTDTLDAPGQLLGAPRRTFERMRQRLALFARTVLGGHRSTRTITRCDRGKRASFCIETKLLRYQASLDVDGTRVAFASWPLRSGSTNPFSHDRQPTFVQLEGGGFRATATVHPNVVLSCELEVGTQASGQRCLQAPMYDAALNVDLGPPRGEGRKRPRPRKTATPSPRR